MEKELNIVGTELTIEEFMEEYDNRSEEDDNTVEMVNSETNEVVVLSEEEFRSMIADEYRST